MNIAGVEIGGPNPCRVVAEVSNNHNGDFERAKRLITAAKEAGADLVKFQCYTPDELVELRGDGPAPDPWGSDGWSMRDLYEKAQTPHKWFRALVEHAREIGIPWFSSVFGRESLKLLESLDCPAYKLAALDMGKAELRVMAQATKKPVIRSCNHDYSPPTSNGLTMYCPPGYPQEYPKLGCIRYGHYYGYSYHGVDGDIPALAALNGARIVECHLQLDDEPSELEANVSLTQSQFTGMVERIRHFESLM